MLTTQQINFFYFTFFLLCSFIFHFIESFHVPVRSSTGIVLVYSSLVLKPKDSSTSFKLLSIRAAALSSTGIVLVCSVLIDNLKITSTCFICQKLLVVTLHRNDYFQSTFGSKVMKYIKFFNPYGE